MSTTDPLGLLYTGRWDRREPPPCNCHRLRKSTTWGKPPSLVHPRLPAGKTWGDWCPCMCGVHGREEDRLSSAPEPTRTDAPTVGPHRGEDESARGVPEDIVLDTEGGPVL